MIKFLSSYLLLLSCLTHFFCCGIPLFLSLTSLTSILGFSTLAFFDFPWFEDFEIQFFLMTTFIFILLVFTQISNKKFNSSDDKLLEQENENIRNKLIIRNIYVSSSFYLFNLLFILRELFF